MKNLIDIIEKLDIDKVNLNDMNFPIDKDIDTIMTFLKDNGFIEIPYTMSDNRRSVHKKFDEKRGKKVFEYWPKVKTLRFADMSKDINRKNPIFCINGYGTVWLELLYDVSYINISQKEFLELLNKVFGWK